MEVPDFVGSSYVHIVHEMKRAFGKGGWLVQEISCIKNHGIVFNLDVFIRYHMKSLLQLTSFLVSIINQMSAYVVGGCQFTEVADYFLQSDVSVT